MKDLKKILAFVMWAFLSACGLDEKPVVLGDEIGGMLANSEIVDMPGGYHRSYHSDFIDVDVYVLETMRQKAGAFENIMRYMGEYLDGEIKNVKESTRVYDGIKYKRVEFSSHAQVIVMSTTQNDVMLQIIFGYMHGYKGAEQEIGDFMNEINKLLKLTFNYL